VLKIRVFLTAGEITNWLTVLEKLYAIFRLSPFGAPEIRAVKKEQKHYHFDWTLIDA
jgi:predicted AAA+ superfamily ATPase